VTVVPSDQAARDRIATSVDEMLVVEAGAGTGKTRTLVNRIRHLILEAGVPLREIAAITFTEAAAAELRDRVRSDLEGAARDHPDDARIRDALAALDDATLTTLHGFAQRILAEHPLEAGLPPRFAVRDDVESAVAFEQGWSDALDRLLDDGAAQPVVIRGIALGLNLDRLRDIARSLHEQWHRLEAYEPHGSAAVFDPVDITTIVTEIDAAVAATVDCRDPDDRLLVRIGELDAFAAALRAATDDGARLAILAAGARFNVKSVGRATNWRGDGIEPVREHVIAAGAAAAAILEHHRAAVINALLDHLATATRAAATERRVTGQLDFHDLLVHARNLVRDNAAIRGALRARFTRLLVDEFQDTDPLQIEIAVLLTASDPDTAGSAPWYATPVEPGRLFVVGDPKQSIYRFRHADVALYQQVLEVYGDHRVQLTDNFRSRAGVIEWVNAIFPALFASNDPSTQVGFEALVATRQPSPEPPAVTVLGAGTDDALEAIRAREASSVVAAVSAVVTGGWPVRRRAPGGVRTDAPARLSDVAILLPTRTALRPLEDALDAAGIAYRVESKSLVYSTAEVSELLAVLAAIDDPTNEVALIAALRTPAFACADDDLLAYRQAGGVWDYRATPPPSLAADHPVVTALAVLRDYHAARRWMSVSELIERVLREQHFYELALAARRPRDRWRRYRFLADQARAFASNGGRDLRAFVAWADRQADERAAVSEVVAPETDDDAVRILTVHGSKGLEFPVVVLCGLNAERRAESPPVIWAGDRAELGVGEFQTPGYQAALARERAMADAERVRLLYVAATRAEDHLVVSLHHRAGKASDATLLSVAAAETAAPWVSWSPSSGATPPGPAEPPAPAAVEADAFFAARASWAAARAARLAALRRSAVVAATAVADLATIGAPEPASARTPLPSPTEPTDNDDSGWVEAPDPPRRRGRAGTARGRAVHAVLQTVDLATGQGLGAAARAQAEAEGIPGLVDEVEQLARAALSARVVQAAVAAPRRWRELAVVAPIEGMVLEGFIDLLYDDGHDLVLVDYKTDRLPDDPAEVHELSARYRKQLAAYAAALEQLLGRPVARAVLLYVGRGTAEEVPVDDLGTAITDVRATLASEAARLTGLREALASSS
jgi:ATP-dependent exoDNAse (exonuclease V) beta subunit